jgi:hypothetical protein
MTGLMTQGLDYGWQLGETRRDAREAHYNLHILDEYHNLICTDTLFDIRYILTNKRNLIDGVVEDVRFRQLIFE